MLAFAIYMIGVLDSLGKFLGGIVLLLLILAVVLFLCSATDSSHDGIHFLKNPLTKLANKFLIGAICLDFLGAFIPNEKQLYAILGAYVGEELVRDPKFQEYAGKSLELIGKKIDKLLEDDKKIEETNL